MSTSSLPPSPTSPRHHSARAILLAFAFSAGACSPTETAGAPASGGGPGSGGRAAGSGGSAAATGGSGSGGVAAGSGGTTEATGGSAQGSGGASLGTGGGAPATGGTGSGGSSNGNGGANGGATAPGTGGNGIGSGGSAGRAASGGAGGGGAGGLGGAGPTPLFNGTNLDGWVANPAYWSVVDGAITGKSTGSFSGSFAMTKDDYTDFRVIVTMRKVVSTNHLGIGFWEPRPAGFGFYNCMLVIPPTSGIWDYTVKPSPGAFTPITHVAQVTIDQTQWYTMEVLANFKTGTVRVAANGVEVLRYQNPAHAPYTKGPIALQLHGFSGTQEAQYKDIIVEAPPAEDRLITLK